MIPGGGIVRDMQPQLSGRQASFARGDAGALSDREQLVGVLFGLWMVVGLFLDGWAHDNGKPESFFTPWHGLLYSGFAAAALQAVAVIRRRRHPGRALRTAVPRGHGVTLVAVGLFAVGAAGDLLWHETLGIEVGVEALLSPTHLLLLTSGLLALSAPFRMAWTSTEDEPPSLRAFLPATLSLGLMVAVMGFFLLWASPFVNDAAGNGFVQASTEPHDHPSRDPEELRQVLGVASILVTTVLMAVPSHLVLRRWLPPAGTFTLLFGLVTFFLVGLAEFSQASIVLAGVLAGGVADLVARRAPAWATVGSATVVLWLGYFGLYQIAEGGVVWTAPLWAGTTFLAGLVAAVLGVLSWSPAGARGIRVATAASPGISPVE